MTAETGHGGGGVEVGPGVRLPAEALRWSFARSSGPGGQNVNKLATKARLNVPVVALATAMSVLACRRLLTIAGWAGEEELAFVSQESRSQSANKRACLAKLRAMIVEARKPVMVRRATRPTRASKRRRVEGKKKRAEVKRGRGAVETGE
ncbi:MAG: aminoacyl-tRNA hydrolase [Phycisphaeraceae bacterium]|nr:aminoacyl-tRNA hydrolase [Phycisphaeraceae bacterium]